jgi:hypothetical protein
MFKGKGIQDLVGVLEYWMKKTYVFPILQYSNTPILKMF